MSLGGEFDALYKRLELSGAVKVKTHQFLSPNFTVPLTQVLMREREREREE